MIWFKRTTINDSRELKKTPRKQGVYPYFDGAHIVSDNQFGS